MTFAAMENESAVIVMAEYIDKSALYEEIAQLEEISRDRYLETPSNSPCYSRYMAQLNERTAFKHIITDFHSADVAPVRYGRWIASHDEFCACSICKYPFYVGWNQANYCPNCGAKMDDDITY